VWGTGFDCGPVAASAGVTPPTRWPRPDTDEPSSVLALLRSRVASFSDGDLNTGLMSTDRAGTPPQQRRLALERANRVRVVRAELKRQLHGGEVKAAETILRSSHDTDTMTVADLLSSQRGWGPARAAKILRSVSLSERKTLGSLTERQRLTLAALLRIGESTGPALRRRREL
jgi:hypothetical protein